MQGFHSVPNAMKCKSIAVPLLLLNENDAGLLTTGTLLVYPIYKLLCKLKIEN